MEPVALCERFHLVENGILREVTRGSSPRAARRDHDGIPGLRKLTKLPIAFLKVERMKKPNRPLVGHGGQRIAIRRKQHTPQRLIERKAGDFTPRSGFRECGEI